MAKSRITESTDEQLSELIPNETTTATADSLAVSDSEMEDLKETSTPFIGQWNTLVSTTNWEKGRIIVQWRESLIEAEASAAKYSDEAWSRLVGSVTGQHVGRLRRVYQRFGDSFEDYSGVFWTHFHAALDWNDAEMWLEGAVQNKWSVSQMRNSRWETMGKLEEERPDEQDVVTGELDEDFEPLSGDKPQSESLVGKYDQIAGPRYDDPDFGDEDFDPKSTEEGSEVTSKDKVDGVRPFENLAELPDDLAEAFESFKLAILRHKSEEWQEISLDDVLASLDALKQLANAPSA